MKPLYVIKVGGNIIDNEKSLAGFLKSFAAIEGYKILIHGGGVLATRIATQIGIQQQMIDGRRITDAETLKVVTMVYAGLINKSIVAQLQSHQCNAMGLCGADGNIILAKKRNHPQIDYGFAGDIVEVNAELLKSILTQNINIVLAPITHNGAGQLLNTNADTIAQEVAKACSRLFDATLIYSFEKNGVLLNVEDDSSTIKILDKAFYQTLKQENKIFSGMLPKLDNAFEAISAGVNKVIIGNATELNLLISGSSGTTIQP